jgi:hypothetical protein
VCLTDVVYSGQVIPYLDGGHGLADVYELWQVCLTGCGVQWPGHTLP